MTLEETMIKKMVREVGEKKKELKETEEYYEELIERARIIDKYKKKPPKTKEELEELQSVLCFGSLAYCCASIKSKRTKDGKPCLFREQVLSVMKKSLKEYEELKEEMHKDVEKWLLGK